MTNPEKPVVVTSVGPSVTAYGSVNPSFMVVDIDAKTMLPVNMHTYYMDIEEANQAGKPEWKVLHDYKESYTMNDLRPSNFKDLAQRIFTDKDLATEFLKNESRLNKHKEYDVDQLSMYCGLVTSEDYQYNECNKTGGISAYGMPYKLISKNAF